MNTGRRKYLLHHLKNLWDNVDAINNEISERADANGHS